MKRRKTGLGSGSLSRSDVSLPVLAFVSSLLSYTILLLLLFFTSSADTDIDLVFHLYFMSHTRARSLPPLTLPCSLSSLSALRLFFLPSLSLFFSVFLSVPVISQIECVHMHVMGKKCQFPLISSSYFGQMCDFIYIKNYFHLSKK